MSAHEVSEIRVARVRKGLSQADLAALVGCSRQSISLYESGLVQPSVLIARAIADALDTSLDDLYPSASSQGAVA